MNVGPPSCKDCGQSELLNENGEGRGEIVISHAIQQYRNLQFGQFPPGTPRNMCISVDFSIGLLSFWFLSARTNPT